MAPAIGSHLLAVFCLSFTISTLAARGGQAEEEPEEPSFDLVDTLKQFLLGTLSIGSLPIVGAISSKTLHIIGRACFQGNKLSKAKFGKKTTYTYLSYVITAFGGGVLCPLLLGSAPKPLESDTIVVISMLVFVLFTQTDFADIYNVTPVTILGLVLENAFKGGLIVTFFNTASAALGTKVGPLVVGTVAGCGGVLIPSGIGAVKTSVSKPVWSSFAAVTIYALATDSSYLSGLPVELPTLSSDDATLLIVTLLSADAIYNVPGLGLNKTNKAKKA